MQNTEYYDSFKASQNQDRLSAKLKKNPAGRQESAERIRPLLQ